MAPKFVDDRSHVPFCPNRKQDKQLRRNDLELDRTRSPRNRFKKYNVVSCPKCHFVQGIRRRNRCKSCGRTLDVTVLRVLASTDKATELPLLVQRAKLDEAFKELPD